jgi:hypothetical protein
MIGTKLHKLAYRTACWRARLSKDFRAATAKERLRELLQLGTRWTAITRILIARSDVESGLRIPAALADPDGGAADPVKVFRRPARSILVRSTWFARSAAIRDFNVPIAGLFLTLSWPNCSFIPIAVGPAMPGLTHALAAVPRKSPSRVTRPHPSRRNFVIVVHPIPSVPFSRSWSRPDRHCPASATRQLFTVLHW